MKKIVTGILLLAFMAPAWGASDARAKLNNFFTKVSTIQGSFVQEVYNKQGALKQTARGNFFLSRPGKFRWIYQTPDQQEIISDGRNFWIYDKELDQVTVKAVNQALSSTPVALLMQRTVPDSQFKVEEMKQKANGWDWFYLTPHRKNAEFQAISLGFDNAGNIRQMVMYDHIGQETAMTFSARSNVAIDQNRFRFVPPAHVDVVGKPR